MNITKYAAGLVRLLIVVSCASALGCGAEAGSEAEASTAQQNLDVSHFSPFSQQPNGTFKVATQGSSLAVTTRSGSSVDFFGLGTDNHIYNAFRFGPNPGDFISWIDLQSTATFSSGPSATNDGSRIFVAAKGMDNAIYVNVFVNTQTGFIGWQRILPTTFDSAPAIAYASPFVYAFARKADVVYWSRNDVSAGYGNGNWSAFSAIPTGGAISDPAAVYDGFNVKVAVRRTGNVFFISTLSGSTTWSAWSAVIGGSGSPALSSSATGRVDLFGLGGGDSSIHYSSFDGTNWSVQQPIPNGSFTSSPTAASVRGTGNPTRVVARGTDNFAWLSTNIP